MTSGVVHLGKGFCDSLAPCRNSTPHWKLQSMTRVPFLYLIFVKACQEEVLRRHRVKMCRLRYGS